MDATIPLENIQTAQIATVNIVPSPDHMKVGIDRERMLEAIDDWSNMRKIFLGGTNILINRKVNPDGSGGEENTPTDPRLGPRTPRSVCATCQLSYDRCIGHHGYIPLPKPYIFDFHVPYVINILRLLCANRGCERFGRFKFVSTPEDNREIELETFETLLEDYKGLSRNNMTRSLAKKYDKAKCPACQLTSIWTKKKQGYIHIFLLGGTEVPFDFIFDLFRRASESNIQQDFLGIYQYWQLYDLVSFTVPVIPTSLRISTTFGKKEKLHNWTKAYINIIDAIERYDNELERPRVNPTSVQTFLFSIYGKVFDFLFKKSTSQNTATASDMSIFQYLHGFDLKQGALFKSIITKRSLASMRGVIAPGDVSLDAPLGTIGVPYTSHLDNFLYKITTNENNMKTVKSLLRTDKVRYYMRMGTDKKIKYDSQSMWSYVPEIGDVIFRYPMDGDLILAMRSPVLKMTGWRAGRVKLVTGNSILLQPEEVSGQNADFDGDEENLHIPSSSAGFADAELNLAYERNLIDPAEIGTTYGIAYTSIMTAHALTNPKTFVPISMYYYATEILDRRKQLATFSERLYKLTGRDASIVQVQMDSGLSGQDLFSMFLPEGLYYTFSDVVIEDGILIKGTLRKVHVANTQFAIHMEIFQQMNAIIAANFVSDFSIFLHHYVGDQSISVGAADLFPRDPYLRARSELNRQELLSITEAKYREVLDEFGLSSGQVPRDRRTLDRFKQAIEAAVQVGPLRGMENVKTNIEEDNRFRLVLESGLGGSLANFVDATQTGGLKSTRESMLRQEKTQTALTGGLADVGYCESSYVIGYTPKESLAISDKARREVVSKQTDVVKGSERWYTLTKAEYGVLVDSQGQVRDGDGSIVSSVYTSVGFNVKRTNVSHTKFGDVYMVGALQPILKIAAKGVSITNERFNEVLDQYVCGPFLAYDLVFLLISQSHYRIYGADYEGLAELYGCELVVTRYGDRNESLLNMYQEIRERGDENYTTIIHDELFTSQDSYLTSY